MTTLADNFFDYISALQFDLPPVLLARAAHAFCNALNEPYHLDSYNAISVCLSQAVFKKLPPAFITTKKDFYLDFQRWDTDPVAYGKQPTVPLYDLLPMGDVIESIHGHFLTDLHRLPEQGLLTNLRQQLKKNEAMAHGLTTYERLKKRVPKPSEMDEEPYKLVAKYLHHTPFYQFFTTQVPFVIPRKIFASHGIILAPPNHGKTQLLGNFIVNVLQNNSPPTGLFVLDPHGDLFASLQDRIDPRRLLTLDPDTEPPPLNFLDFGNSTEIQALQAFSYLMSSLSGGLSEKQKGWAPFLLALLRKIPQASLDTLRILVDEKVKRADQSRFWPSMQLLPDVERDFFENVFYGSQMNPTKEAIAWRLYSALSSPTFRKMFSANENSFNAAVAMRERKVVLVKGSENALGEAGMPVFLQFIVSQVFLASLKRAAIPAEQRHLCLLICDEASHIFNHQTTRILTECRKWGLGFLGATQVVDQIPTEVKAAVYGATAIKIAGPVSHNDAMVLAREMYTTGEFIRSMKAVERSHADFAFYVTGMTDRAVRVRVPYGRLELLPRTERTTPVAGTSSSQPPSAAPSPVPAEPVTTNPEQSRPVATGRAPPTMDADDEWRS